MSSDKFVYLFGRIIPAMSLVLSMSLRFVPKFKAQIKIVSNAQRSIGRDVSNGGIIQRARHGLTILSIMITWALENAIETSDSMRSRGYGLPNRTAFSIYKFEKRDKIALVAILSLSFYIILGSVWGGFKWRYFPTMKGIGLNLFTISLWISYTIFCFIPIIASIKEEKQWKATQLKI
jgi:energy-coupling factor transport system permease protein